MKTQDGLRDIHKPGSILFCKQPVSRLAEWWRWTLQAGKSQRRQKEEQKQIGIFKVVFLAELKTEGVSYHATRSPTAPRYWIF